MTKLLRNGVKLLRKDVNYLNVFMFQVAPTSKTLDFTMWVLIHNGCLYCVQMSLNVQIHNVSTNFSIHEHNVNWTKPHVIEIPFDVTSFLLFIALFFALLAFLSGVVNWIKRKGRITSGVCTFHQILYKIQLGQW